MMPVTPNPATVDPHEVARAELVEALARMVNRVIQNGKAEIQVWLSDKSDETLAKLKELGFEIILNPKSAKMVIGRVPIEKLQALAELQTVRYVAPQASN